MPSNDELCRYFGVKLSYSDALTLDDLTSAKKTRMAAHRELIRRRPGQYPRRWLARRLGVSCMTIDTYNREIEGLHSRHCFWEQPIYWSNLKAVPDGIEVDGAVLVDETGKRYPARRAIAAHLLRQGKKVVYKRQEVNYYWYSDEDALPDLSVKSSLPTRPEEPHLRHPGLQPTRDEHPGRSPLSPNPATRPFAAAEKPFDSPTSAAVSIRPAVQLPSGRNDNPQPPINLEPLAQWLYEALQPISTDPKSALSLATARRLAGTYPRHRIEKGLSLLSQRRNIRNPVGFLITYLRCESLLDRLF
ncbi:MAG: hypothetical protein ABI690_19535 [Chloroflexota bacterium]